MHPTHQPSRAESIGIATLLMATISLSIDIMLPALGTMATELGAGAGNQRQWVITALFIGLAGGQMLFGPLSDRIGRRPAIALGAVLFAAGSMISALAPSFEILIAGRILQGFGAAGPRIVTIALIRDRFQGAAMARVMSVIMSIFILVPIFAPALGQFLLLIMPWRGLFVLLAVICMTGTVWLLLRQPETLAVPRPQGLRSLGRAARTVLSDRRAMAFTVAGGCGYGSLMGYVNTSQQIFQEAYAIGDLFVVLFGLSAAFMSISTLINIRLTHHFPLDRICLGATTLLVLWSLLFAGTVIVCSGLPPLWLFMVFISGAVFLQGFTFGNLNAIALEHLGAIAGLAAALVASLMTLISLSIAALIGLNFDMTLHPSAFGYALGALISVGLIWTNNPRARHPA